MTTGLLELERLTAEKRAPWRAVGLDVFAANGDLVAACEYGPDAALIAAARNAVAELEQLRLAQDVAEVAGELHDLPDADDVPEDEQNVYEDKVFDVWQRLKASLTLYRASSPNG